MQIQLDYETETTVAVFWSPILAQQAEARLREANIGVSLVPLPTGRYPLADVSLGDEVSGVVRGACIGAPLGALLGVLLALLSIGPALMVVAGLGLAGAIAGALVGSLIGSAARARFDDDVAASLVVQGSRPATGVVAHTNALDGSTARAYETLRQVGKCVFLDPTTVNLEQEVGAGLVRTLTS